MPASSLTKLALHLSRYAHWHAQNAANSVHQGVNAFKGGVGGTTGNSAFSTASSSLSSAGAGPGSGAGGAKFHAGRGAHFTYTNTGGRAVVQAGSTANDSSNTFDEEEEHHRLHSPHTHSTNGLRRRNSAASSSAPKGLLLSPSEKQAAAAGKKPAPGSLSHAVLQARFRDAFRAAEPRDQVTSSTAQDPASLLASDQSAELHRDLVDAKNRRDRVAILALVDAYRKLPSSQQTTAGFNAALSAQVSVREAGESLREVRETHKDMLDAGCFPNSSTSAILVKALCARDQEKHSDEHTPQVTTEEQASTEAWRILTTTPAGLQDVAAYNALLSRCAAKGDTERAAAIYEMMKASAPAVLADASTYTHLVSCFAASAETLQTTTSDSHLLPVKQILDESIASMRSSQWINDAVAEMALFRSFVDLFFRLQAPEEAVSLFERMFMNEDGLPSPSAEITGGLVSGFAAVGDVVTAQAWIEKIESLNASSQSGMILAAPDFSPVKGDIAAVGSPIVETAQPIVAETAAAVPVENAPVSPSLHAASPAPSLQDSASVTLRSPSSIASSVPAPALGNPQLHVIDCDLGDRVKSLLRPRRNNGVTSAKESKAATLANLEAAYRLLKKEISYGNYAPPEVFAQLLNAFGREGKLGRVQELREHAHVAVSGLVGDPTWQASAWTEVEDNVVAALAHAGDAEGAHAARHALLAAGCAPTANSYAALISSIRDSTDEAMLAEQLFEESQRLQVVPNIYLVNTVISRLGRARRAERALQLYHSLPLLGLKPTSITYGATLNCAVRVGDIATAEAIFRAMESDPSFVPRPPGYNSMIQFFTYTHPDRMKALEYWNKMQERGVRPSSHTYKLLLDQYATIQPVQPDAMNELFARLLRDRTVDVAGPHWASLITCYGLHLGDIPRCQQIFRSISLKTGSAPDAVAYESLLQVYAHHGKVDLINSLLAEMVRCNVARTAYVANHAIEGYAKHGGLEGLMKARTIFMAMSQPPAGVASVGNHPLPRHHGAGSGNGQLYHDRRSGAAQGERDQMVKISVQELLAQTSKHSHSTQPLFLTMEQEMELLTLAFEQVHPEPSTYERMIALEISSGFYRNAATVVERMEERAFPPALVLKARALLRE
uniref:Pentacotripeptide-repeat region of PRORP domain-containing protein n=1 Tax=Pseudomicrostroma glucosiphilum TaxID=1684307 RepID=A0A316UBX8_9BASI|nr:hypothetical protein BCV69DRAFT_296659 [Pseudomicrostroma glucosiphilum]PWN22679.1 hypothetical protein BCV69DRAFT_296659 [Pseudomicrostroma glucosiphilum]